MFANYLKIALRILSKHRLFSVINVGVVAECAQLLRVQNREHLQEDRALAPGPAGMNPRAPEGDRDRGFDLDGKLGQVPHGQEAAVGLVERDDGPGDVAPVEGVAGRPQARTPPRAPPPAPDRRLLIRHVLKAARQVALHEELAHLRRPAARHIDGGIGRPGRVALGMLADDLAHQRIHDDAVPREADGRGGYVGEGQGPVGLEGRDPGVGGARG